MNKSEPILSIVIPIAPKREKDLWRCIQSILASDHVSWELLLVDNSTENLGRKAQVHFSDKRIKSIILSRNLGILAYNIGFANAYGEYVMILDDDCAVYPNSFTKILKRFRDLPADYVVLSCPINDKVTHRITNDPKSGMLPSFRAFSGASVFKKHAVEELGYFDDNFFLWLHETDFTFRLMKKGYKTYFATVKEALIDHYSKMHQYRSITQWTTFRNQWWILVKHFSWYLIPVIVMRDIAQIIAQPFRHRNLQAGVDALSGYLSGIMHTTTIIHKRQPAPLAVQKMYLYSATLEDFTFRWQRFRQRAMTS